MNGRPLVYNSPTASRSSSSVKLRCGFVINELLPHFPTQTSGTIQKQWPSSQNRGNEALASSKILAGSTGKPQGGKPGLSWPTFVAFTSSRGRYDARAKAPPCGRTSLAQPRPGRALYASIHGARHPVSGWSPSDSNRAPPLADDRLGQNLPRQPLPAFVQDTVSPADTHRAPQGSCQLRGRAPLREDYTPIWATGLTVQSIGGNIEEDSMSSLTKGRSFHV
jgi:hypothetical protein